MDTPETPELGSKEIRGPRAPKTIVVMANLPPADIETLAKVGIKKMRQLGEDVPRDRIISEAIQLYAKGMTGME